MYMLVFLAYIVSHKVKNSAMTKFPFGNQSIFGTE